MSPVDFASHSITTTPFVSSLLLIGSNRDARTDNLVRLEHAFSCSGWEVTSVDHDSLFLDAEGLKCRTDAEAEIGVDQFDRIWLIGFGARQTFLDRMQLLQTIEASKFVNTVHAFIYLHSKAALSLTSLHSYAPPFVVSNNAEMLAEVVCRGGRWVAKPTAGSFGRDVFELTADATNLRQILEHLTRQGYVMLQERIPTQREQRWYLAMGRVIGVYGKVKRGLRGNIAAHANACVCDPDPQEVEFAHAIASKVAHQGIGACAVDITYPYVLDVNFINPGWFQTAERLTREDFSQKLPALFEPVRA